MSGKIRNGVKLSGVLVLSALVVSTAGAQQTQQQQAGPSAGMETARTLNKGTSVKTKTSQQISSQNNKVGDNIPAAITDDVKDANGQVIFPAGSLAQLQIVQTSAGPGLALESVEVNGRRYTVNSNTMNLSGAGQASQSGSTGMQGSTGIQSNPSPGNPNPGDTTHFGAPQGQVSGGVSGQAGAGGVSAQGQVSGGAGPTVGNDSGNRSQQSTSWNVFEKNKNGIGYVSDFKQPPVGSDFVIPPGTKVTFEFGNEAVMVQ